MGITNIVKNKNKRNNADNFSKKKYNYLTFFHFYWKWISKISFLVPNFFTNLSFHEKKETGLFIPGNFSTWCKNDIKQWLPLLKH